MPIRKNILFWKDVFKYSKAGNKTERIWEPSKGGIGIKLNIPRRRLIQTK